jgi:hypothetical protein
VRRPDLGHALIRKSFAAPVGGRLLNAD